MKKRKVKRKVRRKSPRKRYGKLIIGHVHILPEKSIPGQGKLPVYPELTYACEKLK